MEGKMTQEELIVLSYANRDTDAGRLATRVADLVIPKFKLGGYGCNSHTSNKWSSAYYAALIVATGAQL